MRHEGKRTLVCNQSYMLQVYQEVCISRVLLTLSSNRELDQNKMSRLVSMAEDAPIFLASPLLGSRAETSPEPGLHCERFSIGLQQLFGY